MRQIGWNGCAMFVFTALLVAQSAIAPRGVAAKTLTVLAVTQKEIQAAINGLPSAGGKVIIRASRTITVNKSIVIARSNVTLEGEGPGATILRLANGVNAPVIVIGDPAAAPARTVVNVTVKNLAIDGNRLGQTSELDGSRPWLRNNGLTLRRCESCSVENVRITAARSGGLVSELNCSRLSIAHVESSDNEFDGMAAYLTTASTYTDLKLHHNVWAGFSVDTAFEGNVVSDSVIADNGKVGMFMRHANDNVFANVMAQRNGEHGIFIAQAEGGAGTAATGNTFVGLHLSGNQGSGIRVNDPSCSDNLLSASQVHDNAGGGISESAPGLLLTSGVNVR